MGLRDAVHRLRGQLLPDPFEPTGVYADSSVPTRARAFLVLAHAEIEAFLEEWIKTVVDFAWNEWTARSRVTLPMVALMTFGDKKAIALPNDIPPVGSLEWDRSDITEIFRVATKKHQGLVDGNHGIRPANILELCIPAGVRLAQFQSTLTAALDALGKDRGEQAHRSGGVTRILDPRTEYDRVTTIVTDLEPLDTVFQKLIV